MKIMMKHTANFIVMKAQQGDEEFLKKLGEFQQSIVDEREKYFILQ